MELLNEKVLNYKLTRFIGEGGMASVYEGTHEKLGTKVAIKILNPIFTANKQLRLRFENEAKFMASLNHPNIVKILDFEEQPNKLAIVMELLNGQDLNTLIKKKGKLSLSETIPLIKQILDAFEFAHSNGIVHRDIKPANIYVLDNLQVKILDFGIAKIFGTGEDLTTTGTQMGTPIYMSPEQVKSDKSIDHRSDIYSLGVTLFFMLAGKPPYDTSTQSNFEIFNKIVFESIPDLTDYPSVNTIIKRAVEKDRNNRFQSISEFSTELNNLNDLTKRNIDDRDTLEYNDKTLTNNSIRNEPPNLKLLHQRANNLLNQNLNKEAWKIYFDILDVAPNDLEAQNKINELQKYFNKQKKKESIKNVFWIILAICVASAVSLIIILIS